jgi:hypothetical protein
LTKGQILFLPAYWWYSIEFGPTASMCSFKYKTYMNAVAILPHLVMKLLQTQNIKRNNIRILPDAVPPPPIVAQTNVVPTNVVPHNVVPHNVVEMTPFPENII